MATSREFFLPRGRRGRLRRGERNQRRFVVSALQKSAIQNLRLLPQTTARSSFGQIDPKQLRQRRIFQDLLRNRLPDSGIHASPGLCKQKAGVYEVEDRPQIS